jgi:hypothetical protein
MILKVVEKAVCPVVMPLGRQEKLFPYADTPAGGVTKNGITDSQKGLDLLNQAMNPKSISLDLPGQLQVSPLANVLMGNSGGAGNLLTGFFSGLKTYLSEIRYEIGLPDEYFESPLSAPAFKTSKPTYSGTSDAEAIPKAVASDLITAQVLDRLLVDYLPKELQTNQGAAMVTVGGEILDFAEGRGSLEAISKLAYDDNNYTGEASTLGSAITDANDLKLNTSPIPLAKNAAKVFIANVMRFLREKSIVNSRGEGSTTKTVALDSRLPIFRKGKGPKDNNLSNADATPLQKAVS